MEDDGSASRRPLVIGLIALILLVVAGVWISGALHHAGSVQDCVMQGRTNC